jgi:hypothetical protein
MVLLMGGIALRCDDDRSEVVVPPAGAVLGGTYIGGLVPVDAVGRKPPVDPVAVLRLAGTPPRSPTRLNKPPPVTPPLFVFDVVGIMNAPDESRLDDDILCEGCTFIVSLECTPGDWDAV